MAAVLEAAASVECAKIYLISADGNALMSCSETIVENPDTWQMRDIFLQYAKGYRDEVRTRKCWRQGTGDENK